MMICVMWNASAGVNDLYVMWPVYLFAHRPLDTGFRALMRTCPLPACVHPGARCPLLSCVRAWHRGSASTCACTLADAKWPMHAHRGAAYGRSTRHCSADWAGSVQLPADSIRAVELAAYLTHQKLLPVHQKLILRSAMTLSFKKKLKATCATFAHRLLELQPGENVAGKARQACPPLRPPPHPETA